MDLNIVDVIIILIILLGGLVGFKEGAIKKLTSIVGLIVVIILSLVLLYNGASALISSTVSIGVAFDDDSIGLKNNSTFGKRPLTSELVVVKSCDKILHGFASL